MDKRRRNRVQGSWAANQRPLREKCPTKPSDVSCKSAAKACHTSSDDILENGQGDRKFVFQEDVIKVSK